MADQPRVRPISWTGRWHWLSERHWLYDGERYTLCGREIPFALERPPARRDCRTCARKALDVMSAELSLSHHPTP
jgi:hypothetical protein